MAEDIKTYTVNGTKYDIPSDKQEAFLAKYPSAESLSSFVVGKDTFDIPVAKSAKFLEKYPDAKPTFGVKKKDESAVSSEGAKPSLAPTSLSPQEAEKTEVEAALRSGDPENSPILQRLSASSPWLAAPLNMITGVVKGVAPSILDVMDGGQKAFYKGVASALEATGNPGLMAEGAALRSEQETKPTWWKRAGEATEQFANEKMPPKIGAEGSPYKKDAASNLLYTAGEMVPMFSTLAITPNPSIVGVGMKLPLNFAAAQGFGEYSKSGDVEESIKAGVIGARDGLALNVMGLAGSKAGMGVAKAMAARTSAKAASIAGTTTHAAAMGAGGYSHSIAAQLAGGVKPQNLDLEAAQENALLFFTMSVPGIVQSAASTYSSAPIELIREARKYDADLSKLREEAIKLDKEAYAETDPVVKSQKAAASSMLNKTAEMKAIDDMIGKSPDAARKWLEKQDISESERSMWLDKIDDAQFNVEYKKQLELTKDLSNAEDMLAEGPKKPVSSPEKDVQPPSDTNIPPKGESPPQDVKTTSKDVLPETKAQEIAKEKLGETDKIEKAGYILNDGSMLDMSGEGRMRTMDHADVKEYMAEAGVELKDSNDAWEVKSVFQKGGAVRMNPESQGLDLSTKPTVEQNKTIERFTRKFDGKVTIDINDAKGNTMSVSYPEGTNHKRVTGDIKSFFDKGQIPTGKDVVVNGAEKMVKPEAEDKPIPIKAGKTTTKKGEELNIESTPSDKEGETYRVEAKDADGNVLGRMAVSQEGDIHTVKQAETAKDQRRGGVMSSMVEYVEGELGKPLEKTEAFSKTEEGKKFLEGGEKPKPASAERIGDVAVMTDKPPKRDTKSGAKPPKKPPKPPKDIAPAEMGPEEMGKQVEKKGDLPKFRRALRGEKKKARGTYKEKVIDRRIGLNLGAYNVNEKVHRINKKLQKHEREAVSFLIEGVGVPEEMKGTNVERAYNNPRSEVVEVTKEVRQHFDDMWKNIVKNTDKLTTEQVKDYVTHIWDIPKDKVGEVTTWFSTRNKFLKKRYISTLKEGMDKFGLKPKTLDIGEIMKTHSAVSTMVVENNKFLKDLKTLDIGGMSVMAKHNKAPNGYVEYKHPALSYKQFIAEGPEGKPIVVDKYYKIHPDMKSAFDAIFSTSNTGVEALETIWGGYETVGNYMKKTALSASLFHHGALTETGIALTNPAKMLKILSKDVLWSAVKGDGPAFSNPEIARRAVEHTVQLGAASDFDVSGIQKQLDNIAKSVEGIPVAKQATKAFAEFNRVWDKALWDYLHDGLKIYSFEHLAEKVSNKGKTPEQYNKELNEIGQLVNDTFGGQNWDVLMVSPMAQRVMRSFLLSPDWTVSTVRQALAPTGFGALYKNDNFWKLSGKGTPANARRKAGAAFWVKAALYYGVGMNLMNASFRKKDMEENPQYYKEGDLKALEQTVSEVDWADEESRKAYVDGLLGLTMAHNTIGHKTHLFAGRFEDGTERNVRWGKQFRELPELIMDESGVNFPKPLLNKIGGKAAPQAQLITQAMTGKTLSGFENYDMKNKEGWDYTMGLMKTVAKAALPYSSASIFRDDREWHPIDLMMPSSKGMTASKAERLFLSGIDAQDVQFVSEVYDGAVRNNLDAYSLFETAMQRHQTTLRKEYQSVSDDEKELEAAIEQETDPKKQMALQDKLINIQVHKVDVEIAREFHELAMQDMELYTSQYNKKWGPADESLIPQGKKKK